MVYIYIKAIHVKVDSRQTQHCNSEFETLIVLHRRIFMFRLLYIYIHFERTYLTKCLSWFLRLVRYAYGSRILEG